MATPKQKLSKMMAEGLSPIYKNGRITPKTKGLGPEYEKDIKLKIMKEKIKPKAKPKVVPPTIQNIRHLA